MPFVHPRTRIVQIAAILASPWNGWSCDEAAVSQIAVGAFLSAHSRSRCNRQDPPAGQAFSEAKICILPWDLHCHTRTRKQGEASPLPAIATKSLRGTRRTRTGNCCCDWGGARHVSRPDPGVSSRLDLSGRTRSGLSRLSRSGCEWRNTTGYIC